MVLDTRFWKIIQAPEVTPPDPASGFEVLVMNTDSTEGSTTFIDDTGTFTLIAYGDIRHSTSASKFGATSARFVGGNSNNNNSIDVSGSSAQTELGLSNEPFTIETWVYFTSAGTSQTILHKSTTNTTHYRLDKTPSDVINFHWWNGSTYVSVNGSSIININQWYNLAVTYDGSTVRAFVNGVQDGFNTGNFIKPTSSATVRLGMRIASTTTRTTMNGYIDSIRIEKGYARYTSSFTPTEAPFTV